MATKEGFFFILSLLGWFCEGLRPNMGEYEAHVVAGTRERYGNIELYKFKSDACNHLKANWSYLIQMPDL